MAQEGCSGETNAGGYFSDAVAAGYPGAQRRLGWCYENGRGVKFDLTKAVAYTAALPILVM